MEHQTYQDAIAEYELKESEQSLLLYAHYGRAIYMGQALEQQTINMLAIDDIVKNKPESQDTYEAIWAKYDHSKKMVGIMTALLQEAYHISDVDMEELREVLAWRNNLAHRYFRFNDVLFASHGGRKRMIKDFVDFANSIRAVEEKLSVYIAAYNRGAGLSTESIAKLLAERKEEWKDKVIDDTYDSTVKYN
ncbi:hypothetical protein TH53_07115 [Pedobacter lusitanus]|uniref:MAE-28990/MAE-18760-like HEPN domain-containing protein n=1 Tax=Pedobacter lusitanus TaxID=1503925 RepID=A0A0D0GL14_9SPHI|nr:hypothetical protein [Pedobacter lusitanus]KIO77887.1 hypothetical protein TH53_07115 [Pedobacter lusitanus]